MNGTPDSGRLHIVLLGERNSGKSSLLNALAGQQAAIVSPVPGTTTDQVSKPMEITGLGPCVLVDTAGLDDTGELGGKRVGKSIDALHSADIVIVVVDRTSGRLPDLPPVSVPVLPVLNKCDLPGTQASGEIAEAILRKYGKSPVLTSSVLKEGISDVIRGLQEIVPEDCNAPLLTAGLVEDGDLVVLVMPQDSQAPKGRLILPQQQTIRELLDRGCRTVCCTTGHLEETLASLTETPAAIITDSQDFPAVHALTPEGTKLTSFSILLAASKGDLGYFKESARAIDKLTGSSRVLIAEACTHVPASEDIGRVKIPRLLRERAGEGLHVDVVSGRDWPEDLSGYDLIIHCGACMFNRRYVMSRIRQAERQGVPLTNYGITIAYINKLL